MSQLLDALHVYRWCTWSWTKSYWVRTSNEAQRHAVGFTAAAGHHRADFCGARARGAAAMLIWFGLTLVHESEQARFIDAIEKERDRLISLDSTDDSCHLGEIALSKAREHLYNRLALGHQGYKLTVIWEGSNLLTFLCLGDNATKMWLPKEDYVPEMVLALFELPKKDIDMARALFELEAELYQLAFEGEEGDFDGTDLVLQELVRRLATI